MRTLAACAVLTMAPAAQAADKTPHASTQKIFKADAKILMKAKTAARNAHTAASGNPANYLYLAESGQSAVAVVDASQTNYPIVATIPVGNSPSGVVVNSNATTAYVANGHSRSVSVINTGTNSVSATIPVGRDPSAIAISSDNSAVYVANQRDGTVSVINTSSNTVSNTIRVGRGPVALAVSPNGSTVYVANSVSNSVSVISTASHSVTATIAVGNNPSGIGLSAASPSVYVTNQDDNTVSIINAASNSVTSTLAVGSEPMNVTVNNSGLRVYVSNNGDNTVSVIDGTSNTVVGSPIAVGNSPQGLALSPRQKRLYVANTDDNTVSVIDTATNTVIATNAVGHAPVSAAMLSGAVTYAYIADGQAAPGLYVVNLETWTLVTAFISRPVDAVVANPAGTRVYARISGANTVSVIDTASNSIIATIPVGKTPPNAVLDMAISADGAQLYTTNLSDGTISIIDTRSNTVVATPSVGKEPTVVGVNTNGQSFYVASCISSIKGTVTQYSTATRQSINAATTVGCPQDMAASPDGSHLYVLASNRDALLTFNAQALTLGNALSLSGSGFSPTNLALAPNGLTAYASITEPMGYAGSFAAIIDLGAQSFTPIPAGYWPQGIALTPSANRLIITDTVPAYNNTKRRKDPYNVIAIDTATHARLGTLFLGSAPIAVTTATVLPQN